MNFNSKTVSQITGLSLRQIGYWDATHFIKPSVREASGYGSVKLYSFIDLIQFKVSKTLKDNGVSLQKIKKAITYLKKNMPEIEKPLAELKFLTDGSTIFVITKDSKEIIDTLNHGQIVFVFALGEIMEELKGKVIELQKERGYTVTVKGKSYSVILHEDTEDGGYWIECSEFSGCISQGDTVEEALDMIKDAIKGHLEIIDKDRKKTLKVKRAS